MSPETRATLLYGQLQEGLKDSHMRAPAVSGAQHYQELCMCAKNEEKRQRDLAKRRTYHRDDAPSHMEGTGRLPQSPAIRRPPPTVPSERKCYICNSSTHLMKDCIARKTESTGANKDSKVLPANAYTQAKLLMSQ